MIGDLMSLNQLTGVAQVAIQSGHHAAGDYRSGGSRATRRAGRSATRDRGTLATISRFRALAVVGRLRAWGLRGMAALAGRPPGLANRFKNRVAVLFNWGVAFVGRGRAQRVITAQQVFGRHALEAQARKREPEPAHDALRAMPQRRSFRLPPALGMACFLVSSGAVQGPAGLMREVRQ